jgi:hypothetical protein
MRTDGQTDRTNVTVDLRNFANSSKMNGDKPLLPPVCLHGVEKEKMYLYMTGLDFRDFNF